MEPLKPEFKESMIELLGPGEGKQLLEALDTEPSVAIRMNPAKPVDSGLEGEPVEWCPEGLRLRERPQFTLMPAMHAGAFYVQDPSSMIISHVVRELRGEDEAPLAYLDACAAPGGKTTAAIAALPDGSLVVANEFDPKRAQILLENVQKWGYPNTVVTCGDTARLTSLKGVFDIVAVDAPCSGEGMMRKDPEARRQWNPALVEQCAALQREILTNVWPTLRPGGHLIYSTCTFNRTENESMVRWLCSQYGADPVDLRLPTDSDNSAGKGPVIPAEWGIRASLDPTVPALRFMPHVTRGEGLFLAVVRKPGDTPSSAPSLQGTSRVLKRKPKTPAAKGAKTPDLLPWLKTPADFRLNQVPDGTWSAIPVRWADLISRIGGTCRVLSAGVPLATEKGKTLIPEHPLALSTALASDAFPCVEIPLEQALTYLRREALTLPPDTPRGYVLLTYRSLPLGFAKNIGTRANNLYPSPWRIRHL